MDETEKEQQLYNEFQMWNNDIGIVNDFDNEQFHYRMEFKFSETRMELYL